MPRGPYILRSGKFQGKAIESLMFSAKGYKFLCGLARMQETESNSRFLQRIRRLLELGESPVIKSQCRCGRPAVSIRIKREEGDIGFGELYCATCQGDSFGGHEQVPLKFSSLRRFDFVLDQKSFLRHLKQVCGLECRERMTAQKAHDFFYAPREEARIRQPQLPF